MRITATATTTTQVRRYVSRTLGRLLALAVTLVLVAALVLVWARVVQTLTEEVQPRPPIGQPRAVVWNDLVFTTDRQLKRYLEGKGASYTRWVSKHPTAFAVLKHELPASATATPAPTKKKAVARAPARTAAAKSTGTPASATTAAPPVGTTAGGGSGVSATTLLVLALVVLETLLIVVAVLPARLGPDVLRRFYVVPERRIGVLAFALAILFGLLASFLR